jgi:hypothetical protein
LEILGSDSIGLDITEYRKWIGRFNTIESEYLLADIYIELKEFTQATEILDAMPAKFSDLDLDAHQNYGDYLSVVQQYSALAVDEEIPAHLVATLVNLSNNSDFVAIKAYSFGEMVVADWREMYPREFTIHPACVCNYGEDNGKGGKNGKGKKNLENNENIEEKINNGIQIYPNPTTGELRVTGYELRSNNGACPIVEIFDIVGKKQEIEIKKLDNTIIINISRLASGMYFLKVDGKTYKVVKE